MLELCKLALCIFFPILLSAGLILFLSRFSRGFKESNLSLINYTFSLHPEKGLIEQGLLWLSILTPICYFITLGTFAWIPYSIDISEDGFRKFVSISTLPLAALSLSIPLSVLVSRFHATQQTAIQITVTKYKNNSDAFYAHRKAMFEYFEKIGEVKFEGDIVGTYKIFPRLHLYAFEGSSPEKGMPTPAYEFFEEIERNLHSARTFSHHTIYEADFIKGLSYYRSACMALWHLSTMLNLPELHTTLHGRSFVVQEINRSDPLEAYMITMSETTKELIGAYRYCRSYYRVLCEFAGYDSEFFISTDEDKSTMRFIDGGSQYLKEADQPVEKLFQQIRERPQHLTLSSV